MSPTYNETLDKFEDTIDKIKRALSQIDNISYQVFKLLLIHLIKM